MKPQDLNVSGHAPEVSSRRNQAESSLWDNSVIYREWADVPVQVVDPLEELSRSVAQLQDMQERLRFMMREIRQMMKV